MALSQGLRLVLEALKLVDCVYCTVQIGSIELAVSTLWGINFEQMEWLCTSAQQNYNCGMDCLDARAGSLT